MAELNPEKEPLIDEAVTSPQAFLERTGHLLVAGYNHIRDRAGTYVAIGISAIGVNAMELIADTDPAQADYGQSKVLGSHIAKDEEAHEATSYTGNLRPQIVLDSIQRASILGNTWFAGVHPVKSTWGKPTSAFMTSSSAGYVTSCKSDGGLYWHYSVNTGGSSY